jgi:hypothetical protein
MKMTEKIERAAGTLLTVNDRSDFDLEPVCKLLKEAHDHVERLEAQVAALTEAAKLVIEYGGFNGIGIEELQALIQEKGDE